MWYFNFKKPYLGDGLIWTEIPSSTTWFASLHFNHIRILFLEWPYLLPFGIGLELYWISFCVYLFICWIFHLIFKFALSSFWNLSMEFAIQPINCITNCNLFYGALSNSAGLLGIVPPCTYVCTMWFIFKPIVPTVYYWKAFWTESMVKNFSESIFLYHEQN